MRGSLLVTSAVWVSVVAVGTACDHEFHPPDRSAIVAEAEAEYADSLFDEVVWTSQEARVQEGNAIYAEDCRTCHGPLGRGGTDYALQRQLDVPSLVEPDWALDDLDALRHQIYVGHETGMPVFGEGGLSLFQMDAVAGYILDVLRPEVLGEDGS